MMESSLTLTSPPSVADVPTLLFEGFADDVMIPMDVAQTVEISIDNMHQHESTQNREPNRSGIVFMRTDYQVDNINEVSLQGEQELLTPDQTPISVRGINPITSAVDSNTSLALDSQGDKVVVTETLPLSSSGEPTEERLLISESIETVHLSDNGVDTPSNSVVSNTFAGSCDNRPNAVAKVLVVTSGETCARTSGENVSSTTSSDSFVSSLELATSSVPVLQTTTPVTPAIPIDHPIPPAQGMQPLASNKSAVPSGQSYLLQTSSESTSHHQQYILQGELGDVLSHHQVVQLTDNLVLSSNCSFSSTTGATSQSFQHDGVQKTASASIDDSTSADFLVTVQIVDPSQATDVPSQIAGVLLPPREIIKEKTKVSKLSDVESHRCKRPQLWSENSMQNALRSVGHGKSVRSVAKELSIPHQTLVTRIKRLKLDNLFQRYKPGGDLHEMSEDPDVETPPRKKLRGKRNSCWMAGQMEAAIQLCKDGCSIKHAAKMYGIPVGTLHGRVTGRVKNGGQVGSPTCLTPVEEAQLEKDLLKVVHKGFVATNELVKRFVSERVRDGRRHPFKDSGPGRKWWMLYLRRHPKVSRQIMKLWQDDKLQEESMVRDVDMTKISVNLQNTQQYGVIENFARGDDTLVSATEVISICQQQATQGILETEIVCHELSPPGMGSVSEEELRVTPVDGTTRTDSVTNRDNAPSVAVLSDTPEFVSEITTTQSNNSISASPDHVHASNIVQEDQIETAISESVPSSTQCQLLDNEVSISSEFVSRPLGDTSVPQVLLAPMPLLTSQNSDTGSSEGDRHQQDLGLSPLHHTGEYLLFAGNSNSITQTKNLCGIQSSIELETNVPNKKQWTEKNMKRALKATRKGVLGVRAAARKYGIPHSTLVTRIEKLKRDRCYDLPVKSASKTRQVRRDDGSTRCNNSAGQPQGTTLCSIAQMHLVGGLDGMDEKVTSTTLAHGNASLADSYAVSCASLPVQTQHSIVCPKALQKRTKKQVADSVILKTSQMCSRNTSIATKSSTGVIETTSSCSKNTSVITNQSKVTISKRKPKATKRRSNTVLKTNISTKGLLRRRMWTESDMNQACLACRENRFTISQAAKVYRIPRPTLYMRLSGKGMPGVKLGRKTYLTSEEEDLLEKEIMLYAKKGYTVTQAMVTSFMMRCLEGRKHPFKEDGPKQTWWKLFMKRHPRVEKHVIGLWQKCQMNSDGCGKKEKSVD